MRVIPKVAVVGVDNQVSVEHRFLDFWLPTVYKNCIIYSNLIIRRTALFATQFFILNPMNALFRRTRVRRTPPFGTLKMAKKVRLIVRFA